MAGTFREMGWSDREVKVKRDELLAVLQENREQHIQDYKDACEGYREMALQKIDEVMGDLKKQINNLKEGQAISNIGIGFSLPAPESHEKAYDQIIRMMEMSVDEVIELTASQFGCFVMDDWDWKKQWSISNHAYIGLAKSK